MEESDKELIRQLSGKDVTLRKLYQEHLKLEDRLTKLENQNFVTAKEEVELKAMKKKKLSGVDKMMKMISDKRGKSLK